MRDYADEDNLHARVYALRSRLLGLQDYVSLAMHQKEESPLFDGIYASDPVEVQENVFREQIAAVIPLVEAASVYAPLFLAFLRQFEVLNAKLVISKVLGLQSLGLWYDIGPYAILGRNLLQQPVSMPDIRPLLQGTYLADVPEGAATYEQMEVHIDLCAARSLCAASAPFGQEAKLDFQKLLGRRIVVNSVLLSLRLRKSFNWDDEKTRSFLDVYLDSLGVRNWPQAAAVEEVLGRHLEQLRASGVREPSLVDLEHYLERYFYDWMSSMFHQDFHSVHCVACYLWLLYYQIKNLFKIVEGRRFGFAPGRIIASIICNGRA